MLYHRRMILQCAQCKFRYSVSATQIGEQGRTVRCANCKHSWHQKRLTQEESLADMEKMLEQINSTPKPIPQPLRPGANLPAMRTASAAAGLKASAITLAALAAALALFFFAPGLFGFSGSGGLTFADVEVGKLEEIKDNRPVYSISGKIKNTGDKPLSIPLLRITLVDDQGNTLQYMDSDAKGKIIAPGEDVPFNSEFNIKFNKGVKFVLDIGNSFELALRRKPE